MKPTIQRGRKREEDLKGIIYNRLEYIEMFFDAYLSGDFGDCEGKGMAPLARFFDGQRHLCQQGLQSVKLQYVNQGLIHHSGGKGTAGKERNAGEKT